jgi:cyanophycinase
MARMPTSPPEAAPIALVGSGEFLPVMEPLDRELLAGRAPALAFLPTAAGEEGSDRVDYWLRLGEAHARRLGVEPVPVPALTRADAHRADLAARLDGAGLVYLSGGSPAYLADTLRGTAVLEAIRAAWEGGAALAGCSAGAAALSQVAHDLRTGVARPGLGFVDHLVVIPHFDRLESLLPEMVDRFQAGLVDGQVLVGVDEETALVSGPRAWRVWGRGRVWLIEPDGRRLAHPSGTEVTLSRLSST